MDILAYSKEHILFLDGAMGTLLQRQGLGAGELPERWNLTHADAVVQAHRSYFDAGSNVVSTNTFGANLLKFSPEELDATVAAAVKNARTAQTQSQSPQPKWVALDIGPTGRLLAPYGDLDFEEAVRIFAETVRCGVRHGVDLIFIETMNDSYETKAALLAAKENSTLPVFVSNAYGADGKLMTGADPAAMVAMLEGLGADAVGVNCSLGPRALAPVVEQYLAAASVPVLLKPNAGLPKVVEGQTYYDVPPEDFASEVLSLIRRGVRIAGGCCGTSPDYLRALCEAANGISPVPLLPKSHTVVSSYTHAVSFGEVPLLIGERINPTGKKKLKEALRANDLDYLLQEGLRQAEKGVHILDVNDGLPEIDESEMLSRVVCELQAVTDLPLQIDTGDPTAMEAALRRYNGKALINSVNGKEESLSSVLPLAKKYGGVLIALTLDESGIPGTWEGRIAIAERILARAEACGIRRCDIVFDPLALTVSADATAARETLRAVEYIRHTLGCHTSLGVSNVSFGLPQREIVNTAFFTMAMERGLSAAIMNPFSLSMMNAYRAYVTLAGMDENCEAFVRYAETLPVQETSVAAPTAQKGAGANGEEKHSPLQNAVIKGLREQAATFCAERLRELPPLEVVQSEIIPALDTVGRGFEKQTLYLPQLLMAAEAAKAAFEVVKSHMPSGSAGGRAAFVLATVKGDVHDIGKNIVRLLLENYGFAVADLGRDVPPARICEEVVRLHAPLCGLSALMTTTVPAMEETVRLLRASAPWCRIVVGGAVLNAEYAAAIGADHYAPDAMDTVRYAEHVEKEKREN